MEWVVLIGRVVTAICAATFLGRIGHAYYRQRYDLFPQPSSKWMVLFHISISITALIGAVLDAATSSPPTLASLALIGYPISFYFANVYLNNRVKELDR